MDYDELNVIALLKDFILPFCMDVWFCYLFLLCNALHCSPFHPLQLLSESSTQHLMALQHILFFHRPQPRQSNDCPKRHNPTPQPPQRTKLSQSTGSQTPRIMQWKHTPNGTNLERNHDETIHGTIHESTSRKIKRK